MKINKTISIDYELWTAFELYCKERNWKYSNAIESALEKMIIGSDIRQEIMPDGAVVMIPNITTYDKKG